MLKKALNHERKKKKNKEKQKHSTSELVRKKRGLGDLYYTTYKGTTLTHYAHAPTKKGKGGKKKRKERERGFFFFVFLYI